jgi:hypothetical protein
MGTSQFVVKNILISGNDFHDEIKTRRDCCRNQMPRLRRHRISNSTATGPAGAQDLSTALLAMLWQGTNWFAAPLTLA